MPMKAHILKNINFVFLYRKCLKYNLWNMSLITMNRDRKNIEHFYERHIFENNEKEIDIQKTNTKGKAIEKN